MSLVDTILLVVLLILVIFIAPLIILGIVTFFEIRRGVIAEVLPIIDRIRSKSSSVIQIVSHNQNFKKSNTIGFFRSTRWGALFYYRLKSQKAIYRLLAVNSVMLIVLFIVLQFFAVSNLYNYDFDTLLGILSLTFYFYIVVTSLILFDAHYYLLPDPLNYLLLWSGVVLALLGISVIPLEESIIAIIVVYLLLLGIRLSYQCAGQKEALGRGDLKLSAALAAWCGLEAIFSLLLLAVVLALLYLVLKRICYGVSMRVIPFGPFLGISGIIHWLILFSFG